MSKEVMSVDEVLERISAKKNDSGETVYNRFNKKNFEMLMKAMLNDPGLETEVARVKDKKLDSVDKIKVSEGFRKFCKKVVEKCGVDKNESQRLLTEEFVFDNVDGLYEFFSTALWLYIERGNRFDMIPKKDFKGSIALKTVKKSVKTSSCKSPQTKEYLGDYETTKEEHRELVVKSPCPVYLKSRRKVN